MGGKCPHRRVSKRRYSHKTARVKKFVTGFDDSVYELLHKSEAERKPLPVDEDLPGMGQFYCLHCDRYFANETVRDEHFKSKRHKKRVKLMNGPAPHNQYDADIAAGMGLPDNGPKLMAIYMYAYVPNPANVSSSYYIGTSSQQPKAFHCSESAPSFSPYTSAQSLPES